MNDDKLKEIRCQGCNPHFPAKLKRCPKCSTGICSTCMKRHGCCNKEVPKEVPPAVVCPPKKKHTALKVILIILAILVILAIIVAILFATGVLGFDSSATVNVTKLISVSVTVSP